MATSAHEHGARAGTDTPRTGQRCRRASGYGLTALVVAGLVMTGMPSVATAQTAGTAQQSPAATATTPTPGGETTTDTPALVTGLEEKADASATPATAARGYLKSRKARFHIADPATTLKAAGTESADGQEVVRLQQQYQGVDVLGGEYVVRMEKSGGRRTVTGTSGKYYTDLDLDTVTPAVSEKVAVQRAVAAVAGTPGGMLRKDTPEALTSFSGESQGVAILPQGDGVLTRHITVTGVDADGMPVRQEVYVDGAGGFPVLQYSAIKTFGAPDGDPAAAAAGSASTAEAPEAALSSTPGSVVGTGIRYDGETVDLGLYQAGADKPFQMLDYTRRAEDKPFEGPLIKTYDAHGAEAAYASGVWPSQATIGESATADLGQEFTDSGMVDAHWAAGQVYDYYKDTFGRAGLDGRDGFINSIVGVTSNGGPYNNAFWDGQKMVYGQGGGDFRTFSADTDVVGHEMTHGVVEHTANLVYVGQSGAMNEAVADYFGNAIDLEAGGVSMDDPDAALLGEDLCTTAAPRDCALRDLNDGATTFADFVGAGISGDNGGVHLNSTIFSGSLWDVRERLGSELADQIVYRALSAYMTPLDDFLDGRAAVVAAAKELGATKAQLKIVNGAFDAHGIVAGWEKTLGVDSDLLIADVNVGDTGVGAGGGRYAVSRSNEDGSMPYSVWVGRTDGKGRPELVSGNNGNFNVYADTDGTTVVWAEYTGTQIDIWSRAVAGGLPKRVVFSHNGPVGSLAVDGDLAVRTVTDYTTGTQHVGWVNLKTGASGLVDPGTPAVSTALPSVKDGKIAYAKLWYTVDGPQLGVEVFDTVAGTKTLMPMDNATVMGIGQTAVTDDGVVWIEDTDITDAGQAAVRKASFDGSTPVTLAPEAADGALYPYSLTASGTAVTVTSIPPATTWANATLPKLFQVPADGTKGAQRVSCSRGEQMFAAADEGSRVLWLDGTTSHTNLVKRDRPVGRC
ncbi:M4 family metallopeptidase [Isoptericola sp. QY 916]|uniref:M4 family metallopeptidase n=1 Tax=Isoptericola sp. QY 916 TaxID=2782570 RepID=UPI003D300C10|nr:M4 family metallopeptidase [Isoptericola sp. QY 916]